MDVCLFLPAIVSHKAFLQCWSSIPSNMSVENDRNRSKRVPGIYSVSLSTEVQPPSVVGEPDDLEVPSDFEEAIDATGYGRYNMLLLLALLPGGVANTFDTTTMSYVLPAAECDLDLTLFQKGVLNAITYIGMMASAFLWGFLADTKGRRSLLQFGYLADVVFNIMCSMSQDFWALTVFKFFTGFIINGPFAINMTYLSEFHGSKNRARTLLFASVFPWLSNLLLPAMAWLIIPQTWSFELFGGAFVYNSWRMFIALSGIPALLAFLTLIYFPESPRFLMSQGRNDEAMKVFQRMYALNTGNPPESFPVKSLCQEGQERQIKRSVSRNDMSFWDKTRHDWAQVKPLFQKPYLYQFLLVTIIQFGSLLSMNTLRLWAPQLFTLMENFDYEKHDPSLGNPTLCDMINTTSFPNATANDDSNSTVLNICVVEPIPSQVYINSIILAVTSIMGSAVAGTLINILGKKILMLIGYVISAACVFGLNWSPNSDFTLAIMAVYIASVGITVTTVISILVDLIPTALRAMAVSMNMCIARSGAAVGNLLFPILLSTGCMVPFMSIGGILVVCLILSIFIPKPPTNLA